MYNTLKEIVQYTTNVDLELVKIQDDGAATHMEAMSVDRSVVLHAAFHQRIRDFAGTVGLPNLGRLQVILNIPEYRENAQVTVVKRDTGEPETIEFCNATGDFHNTYRLMSAAMANSMVPSVKFREPQWNLDFEPLALNIQKMRYQCQALSDSVQFQSRTDAQGNLHFDIGEPSSHQGSFVFHAGVNGKLQESLAWPVKQMLQVLALPGDKRIHISDAGVMQIVIDSGVALYKYKILALRK